MLNLLELEQLVAFADCGRLSKAAENLHISQPTITRTMQHLEDTFGVPLFCRSKNHISLNETGWKTVEYARQLLNNAGQTLQNVRDFDKKLHTIIVSSCAPAPLWYLLPALTSEFPDMTVSSSIKNNMSVLNDLESSQCLMAVLTEELPSEGYCCIPFLKEHLEACIPPTHELANHPALSFSDLDGHNFLLGTRLGFWDDMCRAKMPASRFLVQPDRFSLQELIRESALPCFTTNLSGQINEIPENRIRIPITDPDANVTYHAVFHQNDNRYKTAFANLVNNVKLHLK